MNNLSDTDKILQQINKDNPFKVPEGYFQTFPEKLNTRIVEQISGGKIKPILSWKPYAAAAILVIALVISGRILLRNNSGNNHALSFQSEISLMIENELYSISEATIVEVIDAEITDMQNSNLVDDEAAMDYLLNGELDEQELMNAL